MIDISGFAGPSPEQWTMAIRGMRNPKNSWERGDSGYCYGSLEYEDGFEDAMRRGRCVSCPHLDGGDDCLIGYDDLPPYRLGHNDLRLAMMLAEEGPEHRKFLRQLPVMMDITAPLYWWKQMDQYKVGTVTDSCSTMHRLGSKKFELADFSLEWLGETAWRSEWFGGGDPDPFLGEPDMDGADVFTKCVLGPLNALRDRWAATRDPRYWRAMNELLPQSYNQKRTWSGNYEVLRTIYWQRRGHKLPEWRAFAEWVGRYVPYARELILSRGGKDERNG